jgi:hypothetical protein
MATTKGKGAYPKGNFPEQPSATTPPSGNNEPGRTYGNTGNRVPLAEHPHYNTDPRGLIWSPEFPHGRPMKPGEEKSNPYRDQAEAAKLKKSKK